MLTSIVDIVIVVGMAFLGGLAYVLVWPEKRGPTALDVLRRLGLALIAGVLVFVLFLNAFSTEGALFAFSSGWAAPDFVEGLAARVQGKKYEIK